MKTNLELLRLMVNKQKEIIASQERQITTLNSIVATQKEIIDLYKNGITKFVNKGDKIHG